VLRTLASLDNAEHIIAMLDAAGNSTGNCAATDTAHVAR